MIQSLTAAATPPATPTGSTSNPSSAASTNTLGSLGNENTFLQLLISQIQNQDPLNPTDSTAFMGQLVSFSQLEQLLSINQGVQSIATNTTPPPASSGTSGTSGTNGANSATQS